MHVHAVSTSTLARHTYIWFEHDSIYVGCFRLDSDVTDIPMAIVED